MLKANALGNQNPIKQGNKSSVQPDEKKKTHVNTLCFPIEYSHQGEPEKRIQ